jgi:endonuclease/exonuclease/phosphatase family metal-dependent hydrolase
MVLHTTAGGTSPEACGTDAVREDELQQGIDQCRAAEAAGELGCIIGDVNAGPEASKGNYEFLLAQGFVDCFAELKPEATGSEACTWDPANVLNKGGVHATSPPQRVDHVLLPRDKWMDVWAVVGADIVFKGTPVALADGSKCTASDHYGLLVTLQKKEGKE